jgi:hypothetical protein
MTSWQSVARTLLSAISPPLLLLPMILPPMILPPMILPPMTLPPMTLLVQRCPERGLTGSANLHDTTLRHPARSLS